MKKTKLEEILETKLPVSINRNSPKPIGCIEVPNFDREAFFRAFSLSDYELPLKGRKVDVWCFMKSIGEPTLSLEEAYQETPNLKIPYLELCISNSGCGDLTVFLTIDKFHEVVSYIPTRGNTVGKYQKPIEESRIFNFDWENKQILEESDLLHIVKEVNRSALSKYKLRDIYNAFQEYDEVNDIVTPDRNLCIQEFEEMLYFGD